MNCLDVKHLTISLQRTAQLSGKQSGGRDNLVSDVNFSIEERSTLAVIGASGSGKTLTALAVMGLLDRSIFSVHGSCVFSARGSANGCGVTDTGQQSIQQRALQKDGSAAVDTATIAETAETLPKTNTLAAPYQPVDLFTLSERGRKRYCMNHISMLYQNPFHSLSPVEKIKTHISHIAKIKRQQPEPERLDMLFEAVQLKKHEALNKYPHEFSGGELQRIMLVLSLLFKPQLLICDEPTASLDYHTGLQIISLLNTLKESTGMSLLFISHDISLVRDIADTVVIMKDGQIVEAGAADRIFTQPEDTYTKELIQASYLEKSC